MEIPPPKPDATISVRDPNSMPNSVYLVPYKPKTETGVRPDAILKILAILKRWLRTRKRETPPLASDAVVSGRFRNAVMQLNHTILEAFDGLHANPRARGGTAG